MNRIEDVLKKFVLRKVSFVLDGKPVRCGKIHIFNIKQNFIKFKIEIDGDVKEWELSYPFEIKSIPNGYIFDYTLSAFCPKTEETYWKMKAMDKSNVSKLHDNYLYVFPLSA